MADINELIIKQLGDLDAKVTEGFKEIRIHNAATAAALSNERERISLISQTVEKLPCAEHLLFMQSIRTDIDELSDQIRHKLSARAMLSAVIIGVIAFALSALAKGFV